MEKKKDFKTGEKGREREKEGGRLYPRLCAGLRVHRFCCLYFSSMKTHSQDIKDLK